MSLGLDTSIVVRLLVGEPEDQARAARRRIEEALADGERVVVTDLCVAEASHALRHHYDVPPSETRTMLAALLTSGVVESDPPDVAAAVAAAGRGAGLIDRLLVARHRRAGAKTLTFDRQQARLSGAERP